jgi:hypothetical protein
MQWPLRFRAEQQIEVHLHVGLGFQSGRLADLVQLLARSHAVITDLEPDRSLYHVGMPERFTLVSFLAKTAKHKAKIFAELSARGFDAREVPRLPS